MFKACNFCHTADVDKLFSSNNFDIIKCQKCGLIYVGNPPSQAEMAQYYQEDYYTGGNDKVFQDYIGEKEIRVKSFRSKVKKILKYRTHGRLLDIGCAAGFFLEAAKNHFDCHGVEFSEFSSQYARDEFGHHVITGDLLSAGFPREYFDVITMWDVLEHVHAPLDNLKEITRILKPGGILVISTGDATSINARIRKDRWALMAPPWHLYFFPKKLLQNKLIELGYTIVSFETNGNLIGTGNKLIYNIFTAGIARLLKLGDIMTLYAQKGTRGLS